MYKRKMTRKKIENLCLFLPRSTIVYFTLIPLYYTRWERERGKDDEPSRMIFHTVEQDPLCNFWCAQWDGLSGANKTEKKGKRKKEKKKKGERIKNDVHLPDTYGWTRLGKQPPPLYFSPLSRLFLSLSLSLCLFFTLLSSLMSRHIAPCIRIRYIIRVISFIIYYYYYYFLFCRKHRIPVVLSFIVIIMTGNEKKRYSSRRVHVTVSDSKFAQHFVSYLKKYSTFDVWYRNIFNNTKYHTW